MECLPAPAATAAVTTAIATVPAAATTAPTTAAGSSATTTPGSPAATAAVATSPAATAATRPAATAATFTRGTRFIDNDIAAHEIVTIQSLDGAVGFFVAIDLDEPEPARLARKTVTHQGDICRGDSRLSK